MLYYREPISDWSVRKINQIMGTTNENNDVNEDDMTMSSEYFTDYDNRRNDAFDYLRTLVKDLEASNSDILDHMNKTAVPLSELFLSVEEDEAAVLWSKALIEEIAYMHSYVNQSMDLFDQMLLLDKDEETIVTDHDLLMVQLSCQLKKSERLSEYSVVLEGILRAVIELEDEAYQTIQLDLTELLTSWEKSYESEVVDALIETCGLSYRAEIVVSGLIVADYHETINQSLYAFEALEEARASIKGLVGLSHITDEDIESYEMILAYYESLLYSELLFSQGKISMIDMDQYNEVNSLGSIKLDHPLMMPFEPLDVNASGDVSFTDRMYDTVFELTTTLDQAQHELGIDQTIKDLVSSQVNKKIKETKEAIVAFKEGQRFVAAGIGFAGIFVQMGSVSAFALYDKVLGEGHIAKDWYKMLEDIALKYADDVEKGRAGVQELNDAYKGFNWAVAKFTDLTRFIVKQHTGNDTLAEAGAYVAKFVGDSLTKLGKAAVTIANPESSPDDIAMGIYDLLTVAVGGDKVLHGIGDVVVGVAGESSKKVAFSIFKEFLEDTVNSARKYIKNRAEVSGDYSGPNTLDETLIDLVMKRLSDISSKAKEGDISYLEEGKKYIDMLRKVGVNESKITALQGRIENKELGERHADADKEQTTKLVEEETAGQSDAEATTEENSEASTTTADVVSEETGASSEDEETTVAATTVAPSEEETSELATTVAPSDEETLDADMTLPPTEEEELVTVVDDSFYEGNYSTLVWISAYEATVVGEFQDGLWGSAEYHENNANIDVSNRNEAFAARIGQVMDGHSNFYLDLYGEGLCTIGFSDMIRAELTKDSVIGYPFGGGSITYTEDNGYMDYVGKIHFYVENGVAMMEGQVERTMLEEHVKAVKTISFSGIKLGD